MSYSRWSEVCDVYIFENTVDRLECCGCILNKYSVDFKTPEELIKHLEKHKKAGHKVPGHLLNPKTYRDLRNDIRNKEKV